MNNELNIETTESINEIAECSKLQKFISKPAFKATAVGLGVAAVIGSITIIAIKNKEKLRNFIAKKRNKKDEFDYILDTTNAKDSEMDYESLIDSKIGK